MNIVFAGWGKNKLWDYDLIRSAFSKFLSLHPDLNMKDFHCWLDSTGQFILASLHTPTKQIGPRQYFMASKSSASAYAGFPMILEPEGPGKVVLEANTLAAQYSTIEAHGEGRFAGFWIDESGLHILTDPFGLLHVFQAGCDNVTAWSTSMLLIQDILALQGTQPVLQAVAEYMTKGYSGSNLNLVNNVFRLTGGTHVRVDNGGRLETRRFYNFAKACIARRGKALSYQALFDDLVRLGRGLSLVDLCYRAGISGGHDSRLVVALMHKAGTPMILSSFGVQGDPDHDIGRQLATHFGLPWEPNETDVGSQVIKRTYQDWQNLFDRIIGLSDGHCSLLYASDPSIYNPENQNVLPVMIVGSGGETARSYYMTKREHLSVMLRDNAIDTFVNRLVNEAGGLLTSEGQMLFIQGTRERLHAYSELGLRQHQLLPVYYAEDRMPNWAAGIFRIGDEYCDPFCPLMLRAFQETAANLGPLAQLQEKLHFRLMQMADPSLLSIPFQVTYPAQTTVEYALRTVVDYLHGRLLKGSARHPKAHYRPTRPYRSTALEINRKRWFSSLLEGHEFSDIWDIVNRQALDTFVYDDNKEKCREQHCKSLYGLLTCATFFRYQDRTSHYSWSE